MNLLEIYKDLVKESLLFRSFKRLGVLPRNLCFIIVLSFIVLYFIGMLYYGLILVCHKLINAPADYIMSFIKTEGREVKHATQAIVYFIGFPSVFALKFVTGFVILALFIVHIFVSIIGFVATLGGITFSPFLMDPVDRFAIRENKKYRPTPLVLFIVIGVLLLLVAILFRPIATSINEYVTVVEFSHGYDFTTDYVARAENQLMIDKINDMIPQVYAIFVALYSAIFFRCKKVIAE